jgi:hypothetical protein
MRRQERRRRGRFWTSSVRQRACIEWPSLGCCGEASSWRRAQKARESILHINWNAARPAMCSASSIAIQVLLRNPPAVLFGPRHCARSIPASSSATVTCTLLCASTPIVSTCTSPANQLHAQGLTSLSRVSEGPAHMRSSPWEPSDEATVRLQGTGPGHSRVSLARSAQLKQ